MQRSVARERRTFSTNPEVDVKGTSASSLPAAFSSSSLSVLQDTSNTLVASRNVQASGMPSANAAGKRRRVVDDDEEDEMVEDTQGQRSDHAASEEESEGEGTSQGTLITLSGNTANGGKLRKRGADGYIPGSIVRVKLINFVTYDAVEFSPGPHLNMIVGPNGTGKSTIVCAIALGLGWTPGILGRAKDVASYVKEGQEEGRIELELKGKLDAKSNIIIERHLRRSDSTSLWYLNRRKVAAKDVKRAVDDFGIDVGNLCCFLPQDRVAEFAQMGPPELLRQTQKAAGQAGMLDWHNQLIVLGNEQTRLATQVNAEEKELTELNERLQYLQRDVQRAAERRQMEITVGALDLAVLNAQYREHKALYNDLKVQRAESKKQLVELHAQLFPLSERLDKMETDEKRHKAEMTELTRAMNQDEKTFRRNKEILEKYDNESQKLSDQLDTVRKREKETKRVIHHLRHSIAELEKKVANEPERPDTSRLDAKRRELRDRKRQLVADRQEAQSEEREITVEMANRGEELNQLRRDLEKVDSVKQARLAMLQRADKDTYNAVLWLREHKHMFSQPVHEPVLLEISIRDPSMASAVESCINFTTLKTFVCQTQEDYDLFGLNMDRMRLRVNFCDRGNVMPLDSFHRPTTQEELEAMGFDRYIIDCIQGPDIILRYLCNDSHLHQIPVAQDERAVNVQAVETSGHFQRYITGRNQHTMSRSQYGARHLQTLTRTLRPARTFNQSIDQTARNQLEARIQEIKERRATAEARTRELSAEKDAFDRSMDDIRKEDDALDQEKGRKLIAFQQWQKAKVDLDSKKAGLQVELDRPSAEEEKRITHASLQRLHDKSEKLLFDMKDLLIELVSKRGDIDLKQLAILHVQQKLSALRRMKDQQESHLNDLNAALEQLDRSFKDAKNKATSLLSSTNDRLKETEEEVAEAFRQMQEGEQATSHELQDRLNTEQAKLSYAINVQPGVMDEYQRINQTVKTLETNVKKLTRSKAKTDADVDVLLRKWLPALEELIADVTAKFSRAFSAIGNAGEVRISKDPTDYEKWGIVILVKFRDEESLKQLTAQHQSGGERSISTITYLLSLTEMSRAPFSLVDEINQGMDQQYERQVHDHMVKVTCSPTAGQYFLITPKLLPNLTYHDRMRVLLINNGDWLPEKFNFKSHVASELKKRRLHENEDRRAVAVT